MDSPSKPVLTAKPEFSPFAAAVLQQKYLAPGETAWAEVAERVARNVLQASPQSNWIRTARLIRERKFLPGGRYLYAAGRPFHQVNNCLLLRAEDSREGWADLLHKVTMALMTGAGVGVEYSNVRPEGSRISRTGGTSTGPLALAQMVNEAGRHIMQGGARRSALWAGLAWNHPDVLKFVRLKNWSPEVRRAKEADFNFPATLDGTNISVVLDREFFTAYAAGDPHACDVYWTTVRQALQTGEPGFSVNWHNKNENLRNACTEVVSEDDSDVCNLGSVNLARVRDLSELREVVAAATTFLLAGTLYSDLPYARVGDVRQRNRRLGLGLLGVHEWLLQRGYKYGPCDELSQWLEVYRDVSSETAGRVASSWGLSTPIATRAIAPTGTIGIVAETTTGLEPIFCVAYRRRYKGPDGKSTCYQYVVDPTAKRLLEVGVDPELLEDAYDLAEQPERRVAFQAYLQQYVDQSISSTLNLPAWGSAANNETTAVTFGNMLLKYLPQLRGITVYPDGARGGQPLTRVSYDTAMKHEGQVFVEQADVCDITGAGTCGS